MLVEHDFGDTLLVIDDFEQGEVGPWLERLDQSGRVGYLPVIEVPKGRALRRALQLPEEWEIPDTVLARLAHTMATVLSASWLALHGIAVSVEEANNRIRVPAEDRDGAELLLRDLQSHAGRRHLGPDRPAGSDHIRDLQRRQPAARPRPEDDEL